MCFIVCIDHYPSVYFDATLDDIAPFIDRLNQWHISVASPNAVGQSITTLLAAILVPFTNLPSPFLPIHLSIDNQNQNRRSLPDALFILSLI
jgi:hypothetical protein